MNVKQTIASAALGLVVATGAGAATNVAPLGTASQSSVWNGDVYNFNAADSAKLAIDGNTNGDWDFTNANPTLNHTNIEQGAWWQVSWAQDYLVSAVNIFNRTDHGADTRINTFTVSLFNDNSLVWTRAHNTFATSIGLNGMGFNVGGILGDRLRVTLDGTNYLHMAEVQVLAVPEPRTAALTLAGLAVVGFMARRRARRG